VAFFFNFAAHNGIFVNMSGRGDGTTKLGLDACKEPHTSSSTFLQPPFFVLQASMEVLLAIFHVFTSFLSFLCTSDGTL